MKKNVKTVFPIGLMSVSLIFFCNPNLHIVDLLPDLFGYILLISGLRYLGDLNEEIGEARERLRKMLIVEVAKGLTFLALFGGLVTPQEKATFTLLAALVFCVIELLILIPAVRSLFTGLLQLATKHGSEAIFEVRPKKMPREPRRGFRNEKQEKRFARRIAGVKYRNRHLRCALEKLRTVTLAFVIAKPVMALLPEFSALSETEYNDALVQYYDFITLFRGVAVLVLLPFTIVWGCRVWRFLRALKRDVAFGDACLTQYRTEILPKTDLFIRRDVKLALSVIGIGMILSVDFYLDYYNVLPDILCAVFILAGLWMLRKYVPRAREAMAVTVAYALVSAAASAMTVWFNSEYYFNAIYKDDTAALVFYGTCGVTVLENLLFLLMLGMLIRALGQMIERYTGFSVTNSDDPYSKDRLHRVHAELKKTLYIFFCSGVACAATGVLYDFLKPEVLYLWMIDFVISVVFVCFFYRASWQIREQIEYKYMLS